MRFYAPAAAASGSRILKHDLPESRRLFAYASVRVVIFLTQKLLGAECWRIFDPGFYTGRRVFDGWWH